MLTVVDMQGGKVIIASTIERNQNGFANAIAELQDQGARKMALAHFQQLGMGLGATGSPSSPYAVDSEGQMIVPGDDTSRIVAYRVDIPVSPSIIPGGA